MMVVFTVLMLLGYFTEIIQENVIYEFGFWFSNLGWMASMYFDGKKEAKTKP